MGGRLVIPEPDMKMLKTIKTFMLLPNEVAAFWKLFQKLDKAKTGLINLEKMYKSIEMERNIVNDALLEMLEIEHDGEINFSDFITLITTYCMFEPPQIMKFCFYVFDQDKTGFFSADDLKVLMNTLYNIPNGQNVGGNAKKSWLQLQFPADENIDFAQFQDYNNRFPRLFQPAFRLHQQMQLGFMGEAWWDKKKRSIQDFKIAAELKLKKKNAKKESNAKNIKARKIKKHMGLVMYYMCPCIRYLYDPDYENLTEDEKAERARKLALARRMADLRVKNPETAPWQSYAKKIDPALGGSEQYVVEKHLTTERPRNERAAKRAERREKRLKDTDLRHKFSVTVTGVDI